MAVFPMFIELENRICLVIGGGSIATRKVMTLLSLGAVVHIVSVDFEQALLAMSVENPGPGELECHPVEGGVHSSAVWLDTQMRYEGIGKPAMIICATNKPTVNHQMALWGKKRQIPVNSSTDQKDCDFYFPSIVTRGKLVTGISTGGISPSLSKYVRYQVETKIPMYYDEIVEMTIKARPMVYEALTDKKARKQCLAKLVDKAVQKRDELTDYEIRDIIDQYRPKEDLPEDTES